MENLCIYTKMDDTNATFKSGEHIFLAAIGGKRKLPVSYVSHEINNLFSKIELQFSRESVIALNRALQGPGKRGSLEANNASESKVCLTYSNQLDGNMRYALGYIKQAKPRSITQFIITLTHPASFALTANYQEFLTKDEQTTLYELHTSLKSSNRYTLIIDENLDMNKVLYGIHKGKWYLCINNEVMQPEADRVIEFLKNRPTPTANESRKLDNQVTVHQQQAFNIDEFYRVAVKMIFNYLACSKGRDFILSSRFDPIRYWILNGGDNTFANLTPSISNTSDDLFPKSSHRIFISETPDTFIGQISFYGTNYRIIVKLCDLDIGERLISSPIGFICDWENGKEYDLLDYISSFS